jgi:hypothetical protein
MMTKKPEPTPEEKLQAGIEFSEWKQHHYTKRVIQYLQDEKLRLWKDAAENPLGVHATTLLVMGRMCETLAEQLVSEVIGG